MGAASALKSEQNTKAMDRQVRQAARAILGNRRIDTTFEHGHWWVTDLRTGAQWDAVDAEGGRSVNGFDFEQVTDGDEG